MKNNHQALSAIQLLLEEKIGIVQKDLSPDVLKLAIEERAKIQHIGSLREYWELLLKSSEELQELIEYVVVPETWFFRDREMYQFLLDYMQKTKKACRILSMPCASGEEPYSIAITFATAGVPAHLYKIDALDISRRGIDKAKKGNYKTHSFRGADRELRCLFFDYDPMNSVYMIKKSIREHVSFKLGNIFDKACQAALEHYDIIICKNLLIYLNSKARLELMKILEKKLALGGILIVSPAEVQIAKSAGFMSLSINHLFALNKPKAQRASL